MEPEVEPAMGLAPRGWWRWAALSGLGLAVLVLLLPGPVASPVVDLLASVAAAAAVQVGWRANMPRHRLPWHLVSAGLLLWAVAEGVTLLTPGAGRWAGGLVQLTGHLLLASGLLGLVRAGAPRRDPAGALDAATAVVALGTLSWLFLVGPTVATGGPGLVVAGPDLALVLGDLVLAGAVARLAVSAPTWSPTTRLLLAALALVVLDDLVDLIWVLLSPDLPSLTEAYPMAALLWGAAALHPSMVGLTERRPPRAYAVRARLWLAGTCACLPVLGLAVQGRAGVEPDVPGALVGTVVVVALLLARQQLAFDRVREVTEQTMELRDQLAFEATHDSLTLLPNRAHGLALLQRAVDRLRPGRVLTVMFVDLDGFKRVNDVYGHAAGDLVLRRVAERLRHAVRGEDVAVRLGGDEFVVLLETLHEVDAARAVAARLIETLSQPVNLGPAGTARVGASIGIARCGDPAADAAALLDDADVAAYVAKRAGKGRATVYDERLRSSARARDLLAEQLREALTGQQLLLHYQPVVDSQSGAVRGYEALVRWQHPLLGLLQPGSFLPAAETADLMGELDRWVLHEACAQLQRWIGLHRLEGLVVAVNLSPTTAARDRVVADVTDALRASGLRPDRLVVELPERVLQDAATVEHLRELRRLGVSVSVSDFGAAVGSLARLADLPVDVVKLSRGALELASPLETGLLELMVRGAHAVGLDAVAEGVERADQLAALQQMRCEMVQGFHVARPMPAAEVPAYHGGVRARPFSDLLG